MCFVAAVLSATCIGHAQALVHTREGLNAPNAQIIFAPLSYELTESGPHTLSNTGGWLWVLVFVARKQEDKLRCAQATHRMPP